MKNKLIAGIITLSVLGGMVTPTFAAVKNSSQIKNKNEINVENNSKENLKKFYPELFKDFEDWLSYYWNLPRNKNAKNKAIFDLNDRKSYSQAIIYYIAGMTDNYAIDMYNKIVGF